MRHDCLEPLKLSVTEGAKVLGVTPQTLNNVVNGKAGLTPEMALRFDKAFGGTAEGWLALQTAFDLAQARKKMPAIAVKRVAAGRLDAARRAIKRLTLDWSSSQSDGLCSEERST